MSEYRQDPISEDWVIIASNRGGRPDEFDLSTWKRVATSCPFCSGHEEETPPEIVRYTLPGESDWLVRVVPNKFPAVIPGAEESGAPRHPFRIAAGRGAHEVIIESPTHVSSFTELPAAGVALAFRAYADRLRALRQEANTAYGVVFKNVGAEAGASLEHIHSQLLATAMVPPAIAARHARWRRQGRRNGANVFVKFLDQELDAQSRVVARTEHFAAICPFASRVPFEMRVVPISQRAYFEETEGAELDELAALVREMLHRIEVAASGAAYNLIIHTAPFDTPPHDYYHWHIEILPRLTRAAGFEWGSGCFINPLPPEEAADRLRRSIEQRA